MKKTLMTAMKASISEVMETMFFAPVEFGEESTLSGCGLDKNNMACQLAFSGDVCGTVILLASRNLITELAENFLGESRENLTEEHLSGIVSELLNMMCGNALSKIDSNRPFELGIPEMMEPLKISDKEIYTLVETGESKMAIALHVDGLTD